jgi:sulfur-carrier protein
MVVVSLHYWAGARAAAGVDEESFSTTSVAEALRQAEAARDDRFSRVIKACSLLVDGVAARSADLDQVLVKPVRVDVLPPFAGGAMPVSVRSSPDPALQHNYLDRKM